MNNDNQRFELSMLSQSLNTNCKQLPYTRFLFPPTHGLDRKGFLLNISSASVGTRCFFKSFSDFYHKSLLMRPYEKNHCFLF
jgi:hypothetical protein